MQSVVCPICKKRGLLINDKSSITKRNVVCENEYYIHSQVGSFHFLVRIKRAYNKNNLTVNV